MDAKERFHQEYLAELAALDEFLVRRGAERRAVGSLVPAVDRQDPDVRRLLEAVAYLSARTRQLAMDRMQAAVDRWGQGLLDDLLAPMPAMVLVQARPDGRMVEPLRLPRGTELRLVAQDAAAPFQLTRPLDLAPIIRWEGELSVEPATGTRIYVRLQWALETSRPPGVVSLYLNHLGDYRASLWLQEMLRQHLARVTVIYDGDPAFGDGQPTGFWFGPPASMNGEPDVDGIGAEPPTLGRVRSFFHFPEQDLYLHVSLPPLPGPGAFQRATLVLTLDGRWPVSAAIDYRQAFQLFVVPAANLYEFPAQPMVCDGTRDEYTVLPPSPHDEAVVHSIRGVYQAGARGLVPLPSALVSGGDATWEVEALGDDQTQWQHRLHLRIPEALLKPRQVLVHALWYDPWFAGRAQGRLEARLQRRVVVGLGLEVRGEVRPHRPSALWGDPRTQLRVLGLRTRPRLGRADLLLLMDLLGAGQDTIYRGLRDLIAEVEVFEAPEPTRAASGVVTIYRVTLRELEPDRLGPARNLLLQLTALLEAWLPEPVRLEVQAPDREPIALLPEPGTGARGEHP